MPCLTIESQNVFLSLKKYYIAFESFPFYSKNILQNPLFFKALNKFFTNPIILLKTTFSYFFILTILLWYTPIKQRKRLTQRLTGLKNGIYYKKEKICSGFLI